jgi:hypothetical protein
VNTPAADRRSTSRDAELVAFRVEHHDVAELLISSGTYPSALAQNSAIRCGSVASQPSVHRVAVPAPYRRVVGGSYRATSRSVVAVAGGLTMGST